MQAAQGRRWGRRSVGPDEWLWLYVPRKRVHLFGAEWVIHLDGD